MNRLYEKIKGDALTLTERERAELAQILLCSLDDDGENSTSAAWDIELEARVKEILDGKIKGVPAEEVFAKIRRRYQTGVLDKQDDEFSTIKIAPNRAVFCNIEANKAYNRFKT